MTRTNSCRLVLSPLWLLVALLTTLALNTSPAAASGGPETRVRAIPTTTTAAVGKHSHETPGTVGCLRPAQPSVVSGSCVATEAAGSGASSLLGTSYGRVGTVVENPGISIKGFGGSVEPGHALNQIISRGVSPQSLLSALNDPTVVLQQAGNRYLYLTTDTAVVITGDGQVVTAWTSNEFLPRVQQILSDARGG